MEFLFLEEHLVTLSRNELQQLCKVHGIKANQKTSKLIEDLKSVKKDTEMKNENETNNENDADEANSSISSMESFVEDDDHDSQNVMEDKMVPQSKEQQEKFEPKQQEQLPPPQQLPAQEITGSDESLSLSIVESVMDGRLSTFSAFGGGSLGNQENRSAPLLPAITERSKKRPLDEDDHLPKSSTKKSKPIDWDKIHARNFEKMDSIANHYAARRTPGKDTATKSENSAQPKQVSKSPTKFSKSQSLAKPLAKKPVTKPVAATTTTTKTTVRPLAKPLISKNTMETKSVAQKPVTSSTSSVALAVKKSTTTTPSTVASTVVKKSISTTTSTAMDQKTDDKKTVAVPKPKVFDLKASLQRPLTYKPYTGPVKF